MQTLALWQGKRPENESRSYIGIRKDKDSDTMNKIHWDANPSRKRCEIELFKHEGYAVRVCTKPYSKYSPGAKKVLRKMADRMLNCEVKDSLIEILPMLLPPKELKIQQSCIIRDREKPRHDELLTNVFLGRIVRTLALNRVSTGDICKIVNGLDGNYNFAFDQMDKFLFRYWNTRADHGWTVDRQQEYENFLRTDYALKSTFEFELENGFGHLAQSEVMINLDIASRTQWMDYLIIKTIRKIDASMDDLDLENPIPTKPGYRNEFEVARKLRTLEIRIIRELSMVLNRFSKARVDLQKIDEFDQAELPAMRVHKKTMPLNPYNQNGNSSSSG